MAKTEVILIKNVVGLGAESDQVDVTAGYARNFLIPQGLAVPVTHANKKRLDALRKRREERESLELSSMAELGKSLAQVTLVIPVRAGEDGKMFGSVTAGTVVDALKTQLDVALDRKKIHLEKPIHTVGEHTVELRLHADVRVDMKLLIRSTTSVAEVKAVEEPAKSEKRSTRNANKAE